MGHKRLDASRIITKLIPIDMIDDHLDNYNIHPDTQITQLAESHATFGQYRSIVVWEQPNGRYVRVVGHGYSQGAKQKGETVLRAEILPEDTSPETIKAIMIADNLHAQNSEPDNTLLAQLLQEQENAGYDLASLGSDEESLRQMLASLEEGTRQSLRINQERSYEEIIDGSDRKFGTTPEEFLERYNTTDVRQIVLIYDTQEYARVMAILAEIRKREKAETNTDAVTILLEKYVQAHELEDALCLSRK